MEVIIELLKVVVLGIVEGITEWLPISSTGHMILVERLLPLNVTPEFWSMFEVVIQLGAIMAVVVLYFHKLNPFSPDKSVKEKRQTWNMWWKVLVAVIPSVIIGLPFDDWIEEHLHGYVTVAIMLIVYGILFIVVETVNKDKEARVKSLKELTYQTALIIGLFQVLAIIPGTSRSGATIIGAIIIGCSRELAAEFTFFMAIPTMFGASALKIVKYIADGMSFSAMDWVILLVGMLVAFVVSVVAIKFLMQYIKKNDFKVFGYYRIVLGIVVLVAFLLWL